MNSQQIHLKHILVGIGILLLVGSTLLVVFGSKEKIYVPTSFEVGNKSGLLTGMVIIYILFSIALLWVFFEPKTKEGMGATVGAGILWGVF